MKRCPITYQPINKDQRYSTEGLKLLSPHLKNLEDLPFSASEQRQEAAKRAGKMSIQGVQPKLSAKLSVKNERFEVVSHGGTYILKPPHVNYPALPENEALTMQLAAMCGIDVPLHGLCYAKDGTFTYFIRRFDRYGRAKRRMQEDFAQLTGRSRDTKYEASIEQLIQVLDEHCAFPQLEKIKLFRRILFSFLVGNEDMHLKNYSLIVREKKVALSPAYDLLNSTLAVDGAEEESALPLGGKKKNLTRNDFIQYLASERLMLNEHVISQERERFSKAIPGWEKLIKASFLPSEMQQRYVELVRERKIRLKI